MRLLVLCTGNTCRSQMAEAFFRHYYPEWEVESAGTEPGEEVHPLVREVMAERGLSLEGHRPKSADRFTDRPWDVVLTVCDEAREKCPVFTGEALKRIHRGFPDPAAARGSREERLRIFREVRNQIEDFVKNFAKNTVT
ncbi:MAG: arsenate reductase ArsC [Chlorobi bacterium]|nr:arsenate reductase ArsC [Chlorobiota bacterium]